MPNTKNEASPATARGLQRFWGSVWPKFEVSPQLRLMLRLASACLFTYWLAIFCATHLPSSAIPKLAWSDKVYHAGAFAGLSFLLCWALPTQAGIRARLRQLTLAGLIAVSYGCLDEFTQQFIPGRCCDIWDAAADAVGAGIGLVCYLISRQVMMRFSLGQKLISRFSR